jgi:AcrR family transcriptional regulator
MAVSRRRRSRAEIVEANDAALRNAAVDMTHKLGWDSVTFSGVARLAGLSVGAVYGRAETHAELGIDLWQSRVRDWLAGVMDQLMEAGRAGNPQSVAAALERWHREPDMTSVTIDLLIASLFDADLQEIVGADAQRILGAACTPSTHPRITAQQAAAGSLLTSFGLGHAIALRGGAEPEQLNSQQLNALAGLFIAPSSRKVTPSGPSLQWVRSMDHIDPTQRDILLGAVEVLGQVGYHRATISKIARTADVPRGSVLSHYATKAELVGQAARLALVPPGEVWEQYAPVVAEHGPLVARAIFLKDFLKPENKPLWSINLELARIGRFIPEIGQFRASPNTLEHTHLGVMLVASLVPDLDSLNFMGPFQAGSAT